MSKITRRPKFTEGITWAYQARSRDTDPDGEEYRPVLHKAYVKDKLAVASDGVRLHLTPCDLPDGFYVVGKNGAVTQVESEDEFPNYKRIIPKKTPTSVTIAKSALWRALQNASIFTRDTTATTRLTLWPGSITIQSRDIVEGTGNCTVALVDGDELDGETISVKTIGDKCKTGFFVAVNCTFLLDALAGFPNDSNVTLGFSDSEETIKITGDGPALALVTALYYNREQPDLAPNPLVQVKTVEAIEALAVPEAKPAQSQATIPSTPQLIEPPTQRAEWENAKPGDILCDGSILVKRHIRIKREARTLADEVGGIVSLDGPRAWAVIRKAETAKADEPTSRQRNIAPIEPIPSVELVAPVAPIVQAEAEPEPEQITQAQPSESPAQELPDLPYPGKYGIKVPKSAKQAISLWVQAGVDWRKASQLELAHLCFAEATNLARKSDRRARPNTVYTLTFGGRWGKDWKITASDGPSD